MYAVITGDIVGSTKLRKERDNYIHKLKKTFDVLKKDKREFGVIRSFEIFRGDSFQGATNKPEKALKITLLLRSFSRMNLPAALMKERRIVPYSQHITDLRLSVGIGDIESMSRKVVESDGEAFHRSGRQLDSMKGLGQNLAINTPWNDLNEEFQASWGLLDAIVTKWSPFQAEAVYYALQVKSQGEIAKVIKASNSAVSQRLKSANWPAVERMMTYFENIMLERNQ